MALSSSRAVSVSTVTSSIGVNTHIDFNIPGYQNLNTTAAAINYLGIKNIRDSADNPNTVGPNGTWQQIANATGAKFDDYMTEGSPASDVADLGYAKQLGAQGILNFVEGGNENDDAFAVAHGNSIAWTASFQQQVYAAGHAMDLPVINMSFGSGWTWLNDWHGDYDKVGDLSPYADYANAHTYPLVTQLPDATIQRLNGDATLAASSRPVITTEIGWNNNSFSQADAARFTLDAVFDGIKDGDVKTYFYALFDDGAGTFGLMNADGSAKPAGAALHNLTTIMADSGPARTDSLTYGLSGTTANDKSLLTEKSDGTFQLALWNETDSAHDVTLNLGTAAQTIRIYDPLTGTSATQTYSNASSITLTVPSYPVIVEIALDTVYSGVSYILPGNVENLYLTGNANLAGTGNALANYIQGNSGDNTLIGGAGNNILDGGVGIDTADYAAAPGGVTVSLAAGTAANGYGGTDTLSNIENVTGSAFNDLIADNAQSNVLAGGGGRDGFVFAPGDGTDQITDFTAGAMGDQLLFNGVGSGAVRLSSLHYANTLLVQTGGVTHAEGLGFSGANTSDTPLSWLDGVHWSYQGTADFNADGQSDLVVRGAAGTTSLFLINGTAVVAANNLAWLDGVHWTYQATGDFNGDSNADLLVQNVGSRQTTMMAMSGGNAIVAYNLSWLDTVHWSYQAVGDFNADGSSDLLVQHAGDNASHIFLVQGGNVIVDTPLPWLDTVHWSYQATGDFNGDGTTDFLVKQVGTGDTWVMLATNGNITQMVDLPWLSPLSWNLLGVADYNGDGKSDLLVQSADRSQVDIMVMDGTSVVQTTAVPWLAAPGMAVQSAVTFGFEGTKASYGPSSSVELLGVHPGDLTHLRHFATGVGR
jgi:hypothetical protein